MDPRTLLPVLLVGCHVGYLSPSEAPGDTGSELPDDPELVSSWLGSCDITEVTRPASPEGEDGIEIGVALEVTGERVICSGELGDSKACYAVQAPAVDADWPGQGEGQLDPMGSGPIDVLIRVQAQDYCDPDQPGCDPGWDLYLWGSVQNGVFQGDCQSISTGVDENYPVTWGSGAFSLSAP
jgi:hypothetical protein